MFARMIAYPDVMRVAVTVNPPAAWQDHILALMNTVGGPPSTKRMSAYLPNVKRKSGQSPDGGQGDASPIVLGQ